MITPRFNKAILKRCATQHYEAMIAVCFPQNDDKHIYSTNSTIYGIQLRLCKELLGLYPQAAKVTQEFGYLLAKPCLNQVMRIVEFRHDHTPVFNPDFKYEEQVSEEKNSEQAESEAK